MNSMSRPHCNDERDDCSKRKKKAEVLLKCGHSNPQTVPAVEVASTPATLTVSTLTLNTNHFCIPRIKFQFASNISAVLGQNDTVVLDFQIFKLCKNQFNATPIGPSWRFSRTTPDVEGAASNAADTFTFIVCDCDFCPDDCCIYSVVVTTIANTSTSTIINNPILSALVVENNCHCC